MGDLFAVEGLPLKNLLEGVEVDVAETVRVEGQLSLGVDDFPAAGHELGLVEQSRLTEQETGIARR